MERIDKNDLVYLAAAVLFAQRTMHPAYRADKRSEQMQKACEDAELLWLEHSLLEPDAPPPTEVPG